MKVFLGVLFVVSNLDFGLGFYDDQPKLLTVDGNLIIESGLNKNITIRTNGRGAVFVNNVNLMRPQTTNGSYPNAFTNIALNRRITALSTTINGPRRGVLARLRALENGRNNDTPTTRQNPRIRALTRRISALETKVDTLMQKITENDCKSNPCQNGGVCIDLYDGFLCQCPKNWEGVTCAQDVNECANFAGTELGCQNGATCLNTPGSYSCVCANGYQGIHCTQKSMDCLNSPPGELCGRGTCIQTNEGIGYKCICEQGWTTNGVTPSCTVDINECLSMTPHCSKDPPVDCINLPGSFQCGACPAGFTGNGFYCTDINECDNNNGGCSSNPLVSCINTRGSYSCGACPVGYIGDGRICMVGGGGACSRANICNNLARCEEVGNTVNCYCPPGYIGDGIGPNGCTRSSYDPCMSNPCLNGGTCMRNGTSSYCKCRPGFDGLLCSNDPCEPNPCQNDGECVKNLRSLLPNSFTCNCKNNFNGRLCEQEASCGGVINSPRGQIQFPSMRSSYTHNVRCAWLIRTDVSKILNVTFRNFSLEHSADCRFDWLQIHDGRSSAAHLIGRFCGTKLPLGGNLVSTRNTLYLWFRSDSSISFNGFLLDWVSVDPVCGETINTTTFGTIKSPGSPGKYPPNRDCWWYIQAPPGKRVQFHFFAINLEVHETCAYDYLTIHDGPLRDSPILSKYCNSSHPDPLTSPSNEVTVHFHSDEDSTDTGFQIHYTVVEGFPGCGGTFTALSGEFGSPVQDGSYPNNIVCEYLIKLPPGSKISLEFKQFAMEDSSDCKFDYLAIYEGSTVLDPLVKRLCGTNLPAPIRSLGNTILIQFNSDWSNTLDGFRISYKIMCGGTFEDESGIITSPLYPQPYQENRECVYEILAPISKAIGLDWMDFDIEENSYPECNYDYVQVFDGHAYDNSSELGRYCGANTPPKAISSHNLLTVKFVTDISVGGRGFKANYSSFDVGCGGILKTTDYEIKPPMDKTEPTLYAHGQNCTWIIIAPLDNFIQLTFKSMNMEHYDSCDYDYVAIYDGSRAEPIAKLCGESVPLPITSVGNVVKINFVSDDSYNMEGFLLTYDFLDSKSRCGGNYLTAAGTIKSPNYPGHYYESQICEWSITVPNGQQVELSVQEFDVEDHSSCRFDYLEIRNGRYNNSPILGRYCGSSVPKKFKSFTNQMYLKFVTDSTRTGKGFVIDWQSTSTGCGGTLTSHSGSISSPNYPQAYGDNAMCLWKIVVSQGSTLNITFQDIDIEMQDSCYYDYVEILKGGDLSAAKSLVKLCSNPVSHTPIAIDSNSALVRFKTDFSDSGRGFLLNYITDCIKTITGYSGVIESPNFPNPYPHNLECRWEIVVPKGNKISYEFSHMSLERSNNCDYDYIEIEEWIGETSVKKNKFCESKPLPAISAGKKITVTFRSDISSVDSGFRMEWQVSGCGGIIEKPIGILMSPNYPSQYPLDTECQWKIVTDPGNSIQLNVTDLDIQPSDDCLKEGLFISSGINSSVALCERITNSHVYTSNENVLNIRFVTGNLPARGGFSAIYTSVKSRCGGLLTNKGTLTSPNYPDNYESNMFCSWTIKVDPTHRVRLSIIDFDIESSENCVHDSLKIFDGDNEENELLTWCESNNPTQTVFISTSNVMTVKFRTDPNTEAKGFKMEYDAACGSNIITNSTGQIAASITNKGKQNCTWVIQADDPVKHVTLTITSIGTIDGPGTGLFIFDGTDTSDLTRIAGYSNSQPTIYSNGNALTLLLMADHPISFFAHYSVYENFCGGTIRSTWGMIASPLYPKSYPNNIECVWNLVASPGNKINLQFNIVDMEQSDNCNEDYIEIRENDGAGKVLDVICGQIYQSKFVVSSGSIWMKFKSNEDTTGRGFTLWHSYSNEVELTSNEGSISTPMYPDLFYNKNAMTWRITVEFTNQVLLSFVDFKLYENEDGSCAGTLNIFDGYNEDAPHIVTDICGIRKLEPVTSTSNVIYIKLQYQKIVEAKFLMNWKAIVNSYETAPVVDEDCGPEMIIVNQSMYSNIPFTSPGYPNGYKTNLNCTYIIRTDNPSFSPKLQFNQIDLEDSGQCAADRITVFQSRDMVEWKQKDVLCSTLDRPFYRGSPYLKVNFKTDFYGNKTGYSGILNRECGGVFTSSSGVINIHPNQTNMFEMVSPCKYEVSVRPGRKIQFAFEQIIHPNADQSKCNNYFVFKNGQDEYSPILGEGKYCIGSTPTIPETYSNKAFIMYHFEHQPMYTDRTPSISIILKYQEVATQCGEEIILTRDNNSTIIHSPQYPKIPPPHSECTWTVFSPTGEDLKLEFLDRFDVTQSIGCEKEYVEVREGGTMLSSTVGRWCGQKPVVTHSLSNLLKITYFTDIPVPKNGFKARISLSKCGKTFIQSHGKFSSPGYPESGSYSAFTSCDYHIVGSVGKVLNITFLDVHFSSYDPNCTDIESDRVEVYSIHPAENGTSTADLRGTYCMSTPEPLIMDYNEALVRFTSTHKSNYYRGFELVFNSTSESCGGSIESESGILISPGYLKNRLARQFCEWRLTVPKGRRIKVEFLDLDLLNSSSTFSQRIAFYNDFMYSSRILFVRSNSNPHPIYSSDNTILINFWVRLPSNNRGFKLKYSSEEMTICTGDINGRSGILENPKNETTFYCDYQRDGSAFYPTSNEGTISFRIQDTTIGRFVQCRLSATRIQISRRSAPRPDQMYLAHLCGNISDLVIASPFPDTRLEVRQSIFFGDVRYRIFYQIDKCGGTSSGPFTIRSPTDLPANYGPINCAWQYENMNYDHAVLELIRVNFTGTCDTEYINVYSGPTQVGPLWKKLCGNSVGLETFQTISNFLFIEYHNHNYNPNTTFELNVVSLVSGCGGVLHKNTPLIHSPGNSSFYPNNIECTWELVPDGGYTVGLSFINRFFIEDSTNCTKDYIEIFDYEELRHENSSWKSMGRFCGRNKPNNITSTGSRMKIKFRSDDSTSGDGFWIQWEQKCGGIYTATTSKTSIVSPGYPLKYQRSLTCNYTIVGPPNKNIIVSFSQFDLESSIGKCSFDNVTVFYKAEYNVPETMVEKGVYCGRKGPDEFQYKEKIQIIFKSDKWIEKSGFVFDYGIDSCGGSVTEEGYIRSTKNFGGNYLQNADCLWNITAPYTKTIVLRFEFFETEYSESCYTDAVSIYKGNQLNQSNRLAQICGNITKLPVVKIEESDALVEFKTDTYNEKRGFSILVLFVPRCDRTIELSAAAPSYTLSVKQMEYEQLMDCHFKISGPEDRILQLEFIKFHVAPCDTNVTSNLCTCDYLEVRDGRAPFSELIGTYCGHNLPETIKSSRSSLFLRFVTDSRLNSTGFEVNIRAIETECGQYIYNVTESEAIIRSPGSPHYPVNIQCAWTVVGPQYHTIQIKFEEFDVEPGSNDAVCDNDYLEIADSMHEKFIDQGYGEDSVFNGHVEEHVQFYTGVRHATTKHIYCGNNIPPMYLSRSHKVHFLFKSNSNTTRRGFKIKAQPVTQCTEKFTELQGRLHANNADNCEITINVPENYTISLYFLSAYFPGTDCEVQGMKVFDGDFNAPSVAKICGYGTPNPIFLHGNKASIKVLGKESNSGQHFGGSYDVTYLATNKGIGCGGTLYNYGGVFSSPMYPGNDRNNSDCRWDIIVPTNLKVAIRFSALDLGSKETCSSNYLVLLEKDVNGNDIEISRFCGDDNPSPQIGSKNSLSVRFVKTVNFSGTGFLIDFMGIHPNANVTNY